MTELFFHHRRIDGRRKHELRKIDCSLGRSTADGFSCLRQGNTKVIASVFGPHELKNKSNSKQSEATVLCSFNKPPFAAGGIERQKKLRVDRKAQEYSINLQDILQSVVLTHLDPNTQIDVFIEVLQSDGSEFATALNAAVLAVIDAGIPLKDFICASTVGLVDDHILVDLNGFEESSHIPHLTLAVLANSGQIIHTSLSSWLHIPRLSGMLEACKEACSVLHQELKIFVNERVTFNTASQSTNI